MVVGSVSHKFINIHKNGSSDVVMVCVYVEVRFDGPVRWPRSW